MKKKSSKKSALFISAIVIAIGIWSCNPCKKQAPETAMIFPKGEKVTNNNFTGMVWLNYLAKNDTTYNVNIGSVTFEAGARTNWHYHKGGQILLITEGKGLYQEKGKPAKAVEKGDVIKCLPNIVHWHGAMPTETMTHIAIGTNTNIGGAVWLKPVTDEEYKTSTVK
jgi:quercetin dioxygenase-like cupin family protein